MSIQTLIPASAPVGRSDGMAEAMSLGATMYVPVLHPDIRDIVLGLRYPALKSVVLCLEDALLASDTHRGLGLLARLLLDLGGLAGMPRRPWLFVRPRNLDMARAICGLPGIARIDGLVIPKLRIEHVQDWWRLAAEADLRLMPTLECAWVLDPGALAAFASHLDTQPPHRTLALRIGGNDLLATLGLRRIRGETIYDGPLAWALAQIMCQLGSRGHALTAPVFDVLDDPETLRRESVRDAAFGFVGKTAVHPDQIGVIHRAFCVSRDDMELARRTLDSAAGAVFRASGLMLEPATHRAWAERIEMRAAAYGIEDAHRTAAGPHREPTDA